MSSGKKEVYPLFDVPGTGFRDREDSAMYNQYHKNGWQATWTSDGGGGTTMLLLYFLIFLIFSL